VTSAIQARRFKQLFWKAIEETLEDVDGEDLTPCQVGQNEHPIGIEQPQLLD